MRRILGVYCAGAGRGGAKGTWEVSGKYFRTKVGFLNNVESNV